MKIPKDTAAGTELDTDAPDFAVQVNALSDAAALRRIADFITKNLGSPPSANDVAADRAVLDRRQALLDKLKVDTETETRRVLDEVIAGTLTPENAITRVETARSAADQALNDTVKGDPKLRAAAIEMRKWLVGQLTLDLRSRLTTYTKEALPRPPAREYFKDSKALTVGKPLHTGTDAERDVVRKRHATLLTAVRDVGKLAAEDIENIIDSLLNPDHKDEAAQFADAMVPTIRSWPSIKLAGLQEELRKLKGDRAAWKGTSAGLVYVDWEIQGGRVAPGTEVSLGSRKEMKDQTPQEVNQDIDVSFTDATDMIKHYHEVKADPSALLSKAKTVTVGTGTATRVVEGEQIQHYRRVKEKREADKHSARKVRFVCVGTRGWTSLYDNGVIENIIKAGMELQLGPKHVYDVAALGAFRDRLKAFADKELAGKESLDRFEYRTKRWPTPAEFETDFAYWLSKGSLPLRLPPSASVPSPSSSPSPSISSPVPMRLVLTVGQQLTYIDGPAATVRVIAIRDVPGKMAATDPGPDDGVARVGTRVYVKRDDDGRIILVEESKLST